MRNASTSMSKRPPSAEMLPVRRATGPSTASRASATDASSTSTDSGPRAGRAVDDQRGHPADQHRPGQRHPVGRAEACGAGPGQPPRRAARSGPRPRRCRPAIRRRRARPSPTAPRAAPSRRLDRPGGRVEPDAPCLRELGVRPKRRTCVGSGSPGFRGTGPPAGRETPWRRRRPSRSGCASPASARSARSRCTIPVPATYGCARSAPASAAAPRRWSSAARSRPASTPRCGRRSSRATSRGR